MHGPPPGYNPASLLNDVQGVHMSGVRGGARPDVAVGKPATAATKPAKGIKVGEARAAAVAAAKDAAAPATAAAPAAAKTAKVATPTPAAKTAVASKESAPTPAANTTANVAKPATANATANVAKPATANVAKPATASPEGPREEEPLHKNSPLKPKSEVGKARAESALKARAQTPPPNGAIESKETKETGTGTNTKKTNAGIQTNGRNSTEKYTDQLTGSRKTTDTLSSTMLDRIAFEACQTDRGVILDAQCVGHQAALAAALRGKVTSDANTTIAQTGKTNKSLMIK